MVPTNSVFSGAFTTFPSQDANVIGIKLAEDGVAPRLELSDLDKDPRVRPQPEHLHCAQVANIVTKVITTGDEDLVSKSEGLVRVARDVEVGWRLLLLPPA